MWPFDRSIKKQDSLPQYWKDYAAENQQKIPKSTLITELEFVVLDTETTGMDTKTDEILSVGAVKIKDDKISLSDSYHRMLQQEKYSRETATIHLIRKESCKNGISQSTFLEEFLDHYLRDHSILHDPLVNA